MLHFTSLSNLKYFDPFRFIFSLSMTIRAIKMKESIAGIPCQVKVTCPQIYKVQDSDSNGLPAPGTKGKFYTPKPKELDAIKALLDCSRREVCRTSKNASDNPKNFLVKQREWGLGSSTLPTELLSAHTTPGHWSSHKQLKPTLHLFPSFSITFPDLINHGCIHVGSQSEKLKQEEFAREFMSCSFSICSGTYQTIPLVTLLRVKNDL